MARLEGDAFSATVASITPSETAGIGGDGDASGAMPSAVDKLSAHGEYSTPASSKVQPYRELLIGCGNRRDKRFDISQTFKWHNLTTLDHDPNCGADVLHDLDLCPWPFEDNTFDEVHAMCVLEHLGRQGDYQSFFATFGEIYRILKPDGLLYAICPSRSCEWLWGDPSHTRAIQPESLVFLSQQQYLDQVGLTPMTDFRWLWKGDFEPLAIVDDGRDFKFIIRAVKPARG